MAEMTARTAIDILAIRNNTFNGSECCALPRDIAIKISNLIAAQAAEIAKQQRMIETMLVTLSESSLCCDDNRPCPKDYVKVGCNGCWLKWLTEQVGEK